MTHIIVATDLSERSDRALRRATLLARDMGAKMTLITAVEGDRPQRLVVEEKRGTEALLRDMSATICNVDHISCETRVIIAEPSQAIVQFSAEMAPDLLVIGPHRRQLFRDIFIGTTAERTIRNAPCPVLMVNAVPAAPYKNVLLTTDLSDGSRDAIERYWKMGWANYTSHSILNVFEAPILQLTMTSAMTEQERRLHIEDEKQKAAVALSTFMGKIKIKGVHPVLRHSGAETNHEILAAAAETSADLIVLATQSKRGLERWLLGSVTEKVLMYSEIDVLTIPQMRTD
ncbi:universal stress protein [Pseudomonas sp. ABY48]|uniref:universal stress protein n=1 Tax=Pseudomonas sp. ABY48 TaxID=3402865 RepID=UPI003B42A32B